MHTQLELLHTGLNEGLSWIDTMEMVSRVIIETLELCKHSLEAERMRSCSLERSVRILERDLMRKEAALRQERLKVELGTIQIGYLQRTLEAVSHLSGSSQRELIMLKSQVR